MLFALTLTCLGCGKPVLDWRSLESDWNQVLTLSLTMEAEKHREQCAQREPQQATKAQKA